MSFFLSKKNVHFTFLKKNPCKKTHARDIFLFKKNLEISKLIVTQGQIYKLIVTKTIKSGSEFRDPIFFENYTK